MDPIPRFAPPPLRRFLFLVTAAALVQGCDFSTTIHTQPEEPDGPYVGREVESVTWNADFTRVDITYEAEDCEGGEGDTCDIDAVTLICRPGTEGTIENCDVSN